MISLSEETSKQRDVANTHRERHDYDDLPDYALNDVATTSGHKRPNETKNAEPPRYERAQFKTYSIFNDRQFRSFALWNFRTLSNFQIYSGTSNNEPCVYYVRNSEFTPKMPDVLLFEGGDQSRPPCATAKFHAFRTDITLAVGEGCERNGSSSLPGFVPPIYETLKKVSRVAHSQYAFSTDLTRDGTRREYQWRRKWTGKSGCWDYECLDEAGEVVARFENAGLQWNKSGDFRFIRSEGMKWEWMVLVAFLSIREKENRFAVYSHGVCV